MQSEDIAANVSIGRYGADSIELKCASDTPLRILTHCNTGSLATAGFGTALGMNSFQVFQFFFFIESFHWPIYRSM